jgi:hypothetical protein
LLALHEACHLSVIPPERVTHCLLAGYENKLVRMMGSSWLKTL